MAIKPIIFNTEMVQAILRGQKTCTRRIVKDFISDDAIWGYTAFTPKRYISSRGTFPVGYGEKFFKLPYQKGDILYVRETWGTYSEYWWEADYFMYGADYPKGATTYTYSNGIVCDLPKWHPSIYMPKEAARIWLKVTDVRVERLQEITEVQAQAEGCTSGLLTGACTARGQFEDLWNTTIKKSDLDRYGWDANPYVWVIEFERCEKPEEERR